jgi:hypothetical protein
MWPTPKASADKYARPRENDGGDLQAAVVEWRTPQARDGDQRGPSLPQKRVEQGHSVSVHNQIGGQLNPTWVEWLMGFPLGWTDLEDSGTPLSPKSQSGLGDD